MVELSPLAISLFFLSIFYCVFIMCHHLLVVGKNEIAILVVLLKITLTLFLNDFLKNHASLTIHLMHHKLQNASLETFNA